MGQDKLFPLPLYGKWWAGSNVVRVKPALDDEAARDIPMQWFDVLLTLSCAAKGRKLAKSRILTYPPANPLIKFLS
jgi:hypothetical protein